MIANLHGSGIVHGDVTTSNLIESGGRVHLIDFGLSNYSKLIEDRGVDLLLAKRSLRSTHGKGFAKLFANFLSGYSSSCGSSGKIVVEKMNEIERRGRYNERAG
jgi:Kae1-associated kinase Bud32